MSYNWRRSSNPNLRRRKSFKMNINGKERIIIPCTDVMETKSYFLGRKTYPLANPDGSHNTRLDHSYNIETRMFLGYWDDEAKSYIALDKRQYLTNYIAFDFDFDEKHFPGINHEAKLKAAVDHLEKIIGFPGIYIIRNKTEYTQEEIDYHFTKADGSINLPKRYGCQIIYQLSETLDARNESKKELYERVREKITQLTDGDPAFRGQMVKNFNNKTLFDITEHTLDTDKTGDHLSKGFDIYKFAKSHMLYCPGCRDANDLNVDEIYNSTIYNNPERNKNLEKHLEVYSNMLLSYYYDLNSWKFKSENDNNNDNNKIENTLNYNNKLSYIKNERFKFKQDSRNNTLFSFFNAVPFNTLLSIEYKDYQTFKSNGLFDECVIKEDMSEKEFYNTKESSVSYRQKYMLMDGLDSNLVTSLSGDNRVFKMNQKEYDSNFFKNHKNEFITAINYIKDFYKKDFNRCCCYTVWEDNKRKKKIRLPINYLKVKNEFNEDGFYTNNSDNINPRSILSKMLANIFLTVGPDLIITNIKTLFSQNLLDIIQEDLYPYFAYSFDDINHECQNYDISKSLGLYDLYLIIKDAIYYTHFTYYYSIQSYRNNNECGAREYIEGDSLICEDTIAELKKEARIEAEKAKYEKNHNRKSAEEIIQEYYGISLFKNNFGCHISNNQFKIYYNRLKNNEKDNLLKENGTAKPVSFYANYFHIRISYATLYSRKIKEYTKFIELMKKIIVLIKKINEEKNYMNEMMKKGLNNILATCKKNYNSISKNSLEVSTIRNIIIFIFNNIYGKDNNCTINYLNMIEFKYILSYNST